MVGRQCPEMYALQLQHFYGFLLNFVKMFVSVIPQSSSLFLSRSDHNNAQKLKTVDAYASLCDAVITILVPSIFLHFLCLAAELIKMKKA